MGLSPFLLFYNCTNKIELELARLDIRLYRSLIMAIFRIHAFADFGLVQRYFLKLSF